MPLDNSALNSRVHVLVKAVAGFAPAAEAATLVPAFGDRSSFATQLAIDGR